MSKKFSEHESQLIRQSLVNACKDCWNRYGYHKTNVRELAAMANISVGAFYQFFSSKELLFMETAKSFEKQIEDICHKHLMAQPDKNGVAESLKDIAGFYIQMPWIASIYEDWAVIERKLPPNFTEQDFQGDKLRIERLTEQYGIKAKRSTEEVTQIINLMLSSVMQARFIPGDLKVAINFIIDAVVDKLFD
jgi:AcrR family transcriptional regulator